jgi:hypothetical protein
MAGLGVGSVDILPSDQMPSAARDADGPAVTMVIGNLL